MASFKEYPEGQLQRTRRRLRREILVLHRAGANIRQLHPLSTRLLNVRQDLRRMQARCRAVSCTTLNANIFSVSEALAMFRFKLDDLDRVADLLDVDTRTSRRRYQASAVDCLCSVLLSSP